MPGLHSPFSRHLFTLNGNVLASGGAKNLAKGQFTIVKSGVASANGAVVVSDFAGLPESTVYEMRLGKAVTPNVRTAMNGKPYSSELFTIKDIVSIEANAPKFFERTVGSIIVGYNGINADTAIELLEGQTTVLDITLSGEHVGFITGNCEYNIKLNFGREVGETNQEAIERLVKRLKEQTFPQGVNITEVLDIRVVNSENEPLSGVPYVFSSLTLTDEGDSNALADIQAQYPLHKVELTNRVDLVSTYTILHAQSVTLADYVKTVASYVKGCEDCAADYSEVGEGVIYSVSIEDEGNDLTTTVDNLPGFVKGTVIKKGQDGSRGIYTVVLDNALTDAEIASYVATAGAQATAIIELLGDVTVICANASTTSTAWVAGQVCQASVELYKIQLKDDDCDGSRLAELQAQYPGLVIEAGVPTGQASQTITLSGVAGDAVIVVNGVSYTTAFDTDLTNTAGDFVTAHAAAILADTGVAVTSALAVITFAGDAVGFPAIASVAGGLVETVSAIDYLTTASVGGCQRVYSTSVVTDIVCEECSDIFLDQFSSEAPAPFDFVEWVKVASNVPSETALMGIKLTGKLFDMIPTEATRDSIPFYETSTRVKASGGYLVETAFSFDPNYNDIFAVKRLSRAQDRDNLGAHLMSLEEASKYYFDGEVRHKNNLFAKAFLGEESVLDFQKQYVQYSITIHDSKYSQGRGGRSDMGTTYSVWAELGRNVNLEHYINKLASKAGLPAVSALVHNN